MFRIFFVCLLFTACSESPREATWMLTGFVKADSINPILEPLQDSEFNCPVRDSTIHWESRNVLNPAAIVRNDTVFLFYRAQDESMTSRIGVAVSVDGLHFKRHGEPVFYPEPSPYDSLEWPGGVEDPRIVETEDGLYLLTYTAYDGKTARLCLASSRDLFNWERHGPVLQGEEYANLWSKSGAVVCKQEGQSVKAVRINGRYWMYWGDTDLFMASSADGINWEPALNAENNRLISVLHPRPGYFDSRLVEPGPYALLTDAGILLIYNASNAQNYNDERLPVYAYAAGQALFDSKEPWKILDRDDEYFIHPEKPYEITGEVNQVCFVEGLVFFKNNWFLYYGTADSRIAVAVK